MKKLISFSMFLSIILIMVIARTTANAQQIVVRPAVAPVVVVRPYYAPRAYVYGGWGPRAYYRPARVGLRWHARPVMRRGRYGW